MVVRVLPWGGGERRRKDFPPSKNLHSFGVVDANRGLSLGTYLDNKGKGRGRPRMDGQCVCFRSWVARPRGEREKEKKKREAGSVVLDHDQKRRCSVPPEGEKGEEKGDVLRSVHVPYQPENRQRRPTIVRRKKKGGRIRRLWQYFFKSIRNTSKARGREKKRGTGATATSTLISGATKPYQDEGKKKR